MRLLCVRFEAAVFGYRVGRSLRYFLALANGVGLQCSAPLWSVFCAAEAMGMAGTSLSVYRGVLLRAQQNDNDFFFNACDGVATRTVAVSACRI